MNNLHKLPLDEQLAEFVDALLEGRETVLSPDQETAALQALTEKIVQQNEAYPGAPKIDSQKRLALLTEYRSVFRSHKTSKSGDKRARFGSNWLLQWGTAAGVFAVIAVVFFLFRSLNIQATPATSGGSSLIVPLAAAGIALVIMAFIWIRSNRK